MNWGERSSRSLRTTASALLDGLPIKDSQTRKGSIPGRQHLSRIRRGAYLMKALASIVESESCGLAASMLASKLGCSYAAILRGGSWDAEEDTASAVGTRRTAYSSFVSLPVAEGTSKEQPGVASAPPPLNVVPTWARTQSPQSLSQSIQERHEGEARILAGSSESEPRLDLGPNPNEAADLHSPTDTDEQPISGPSPSAPPPVSGPSPSAPPAAHRRGYAPDAQTAAFVSADRLLRLRSESGIRIGSQGNPGETDAAAEQAMSTCGTLLVQRGIRQLEDILGRAGRQLGIFKPERRRSKLGVGVGPEPIRL